MRRITLWSLSTVSALVLLFSYHTSTDRMSAASTTVSPTGTTTTPTAAPKPSTPLNSGSGAAGPASNSPGHAASRRVTGDAADTPYGPVQVEVTLTAGKVSAVHAVVYPQESRRDQEINSVAIPQLDQEATSTGSARIDMVSARPSPRRPGVLHVAVRQRTDAYAVRQEWSRPTRPVAHRSPGEL